MYGRVIGLLAAISLSLLAVGCGGTCDELCGFAADYYEECLPQWNTTWDGLAPEGESWSSRGAAPLANVHFGESNRLPASATFHQE